MSSQKFTAACVQLNAGNDPTANILRGSELIKQAAGKGAEFITLPENSFFMRGEGDEIPAAENIILPMRKLSADLKIWLQLCVLVKADNKKHFNRSILLAPNGEIAAQYDKIHLFDVDIPGGETHRESDTITPGAKTVTAELPWTKLGMTICYDLRFPQTYRQLSQDGAEIITVPSAFTFKTGEAHWHTLLRARAIENSCYIIAAAQCGHHPRNRRTYGHSMIIDPWGKILAEASEDKEQIIAGEIDLNLVREIRTKLPAWKI